MTTIACRARRPRLMATAVAATLVSAVGAAPSGAQVAERTTPLGVAPGAPAGSYPLSDLERVNLFNGSLSFHLPLLTIGGRGDATHTVGLTIERHWGVMHVSDMDARLVPRFDWWRGFRPGFGPGALRSYRDFEPIDGNDFMYLTRFAFTGPDETQQEMRDAATEGQPIPNSVEPRGQIFHTSDGTAMTYVSDQPVTTAGVENGRLLFRDGRTYRIDGGLVTSIRDRSGNLLQFQYNGAQQQVSRIIDSVGRVYDFVYEGVGGPNPVEKILFKGFGGAPREIRVEHGPLSSALVDGEEIGTLAELFPELPWFVPDLEHSPSVRTRVVLPDGRDYVFKYNRYGELAEVTLPTGGLIQYEHGAGIPGGGSGAFATFIYRRVLKKTVTGDSSPAMTTVFGQENLDGPNQFIDVERRGPAPANQLISRTRHFFFGRAAAELTTATPLYYPHWTTGREYRTEVWVLVNNAPMLLRATDHAWAQRTPAPAWNTSIPNDPRMIETRTTLDDGRKSKRVFTHDPYNNVTSTIEHGYGSPEPGAAVRRAVTDYLVLNGGRNYATDLAIHIRDLPEQEWLFEFDTQGAQVIRSLTVHRYDNYSSTPGHAALLARPNIVSLDAGYANPGITTRGNATSTERWLDTTASFLTSYRQYDVAGNVVKTIDPRGHATAYGFGDVFGTPNGEARANVAPPELGGLLSFAFATSITNPKAHQTFTQYDFHLGRPVDHEDANGVVGSVFYADALDRPTAVIRAQGRPERTSTAFVYADAPPTPRVDVYADKDAQGPLHTAVLFDSLGREIRKLTYETATDAIASDERLYDAAGRLQTLFNPYRSGDTQFAISTLYDALDRPTTVVGPDGATTTTSYSGPLATTTDAAGKVRRMEADALGRTISVSEDPSALNFVTTYRHDVFDNVVEVNQGAQQRTFAYDSLSRLICASTPEARVGTAACVAPLPASGLTRYAYDPSGNLTGRTDARQVATGYGYDELDRMTSRTYGDGTPAVSFGYDGAVSGKGRLWFVSSTIGGQTWGHANDVYDALGRIKTSRQISANVNYTFQYVYDLSGSLVSETYPSGRVIATSYDLAGRAKKVGEGAYAYGEATSNGNFSPHGALLNLKLGVPGSERWRQAQFNCHLQQRLAGLGSSVSAADILGLVLRHGTENSCQDTPGQPGNNGNPLSQLVVVNGVTRFTQNFSYDGANRLATATETGSGGGPVWAQTYGYDRWGNRAVLLPGSYIPQQGLTPTSTGQFSAATNRITVSPWTYDNAGNLTQDGLSRLFTYDAENRQKNASSTSYLYDGDGRRVRKTVSGQHTTYVYDAFGRLAAEYGPTNPILGMRFIVPDHLGSTRLTMNEKGTVVTRNDYLPFGEELPATAAFQRADYGADQTVRHRFTGKERDLETGLDYFEARYGSGAQGRFTGADPVMESDQQLADPQQWNRYGYVRNSPLSRVDPDGRVVIEIPRGAKAQIQFNRQLREEVLSGLGLERPKHPLARLGRGVVGFLVGAILPGDEASSVQVAAFGMAAPLRAPLPRGLAAGQAGRFADLDAMGVVGDALTPHHMPLAASHFTSRAEGGALVLPHHEHLLTRTYGSRGRAIAREEVGLPFRDVLAHDLRDIRRLFGSRYNDGLRQLIDYYRRAFPDLYRKVSP